MKLFWHPKNPLSEENSVKPAPLGAGRSFLWIFMILNIRSKPIEAEKKEEAPKEEKKK